MQQIYEFHIVEFVWKLTLLLWKLSISCADPDWTLSKRFTSCCQRIFSAGFLFILLPFRPFLLLLSNGTDVEVKSEPGAPAHFLCQNFSLEWQLSEYMQNILGFVLSDFIKNSSVLSIYRTIVLQKPSASIYFLEPKIRILIKIKFAHSWCWNLLMHNIDADLRVRSFCLRFSY